MNKPVIYIASIVGIALAAASLIYGAFMPFTAAQAFVDATQAISSTRSITEFEQNFTNAFNLANPIGAQEMTKFLQMDIMQIMSPENNQPEEVGRAFIDYIEPHVIPTDTRHLLSAGNLRVVMLNRFRKEEDYNKALDYYLKARAIGHKLPPVLYGLLSLYSAKGDDAAAREVAETILKYWPNDARVAQFLGAQKK